MSYIAVVDFGSFTEIAAVPPAAPKNLEITYVNKDQDPSQPDVTFQWDASKVGGSPIAGYQLMWGTDPKNLSNTITLALGHGSPLKFNPGNNTYTYSLPNGTLQPFPPGSKDEYYFAVDAYDSGTAEFSLKNGSQNKWYGEHWFPADVHQLAFCKIPHP